MRTYLLAPVLGLVLSMPATSLHAASMITGPGSVSLDRTDDFTFTISFAATTGTDLPGTLGSITFNYLSANAAGTAWNFSYSVDNTSVAPSASSRLGVFGFNTSPDVSSVTTGGGNRFSAALNGGNFSGLGNREICFYSGPNCNGSGNNGVTVVEAPVSGTFTLNFAAATQTVVLDNFAARWQATGARADGSNSGPGMTTAVPEPTMWAMMIGGFGLAGGAMRRRTTKVSYTTA